ncbi:hypothetical protein KAU33_09350 [Candidatus Dependentiae bacterium]|nr:hypothetical protein [Candidatus Dependentiae bacterium]
MINLTPEQFSTSADIGILVIIIAGGLVLMKSSRKLKNLDQRLRILAGIKVE